MSKHRKKHIGKQGVHVLTQYESAIIKRASEARRKLLSKQSVVEVPMTIEEGDAIDAEWEAMKNDIKSKGKTYTGKTIIEELG